MDAAVVSLSGRWRVVCLALALSLAVGPAGTALAAKAPPPAASSAKPEPTTEANVHLPTVEEIKMGRDAVAQVEKEYKLVQDEAQLRRLRAIGDEIVRASNDPVLIRAYREAYKVPKKGDKSKRVPFQFSFKIVKATEVNAFSLAGGPIYFTTGLLEYVQSDHELAAVMAHELAHVLHHHLVHLVNRQAKAEQKMLWVMLATLLAGAAGSPDVGNVMLGAQLYTIAKQYGYGREAEKDADKTGIQYLLRSKYSPVGMLTFMKRLARDENRRPPVEMGIFQSHPYTKERADAISGHLADAGIKVDRGVERDISNAFQISYRTTEMSGREVGEVMLNGQLLFRPAVSLEGRTPAQRASRIADELRRLLDENLLLRQVHLSSDRTTVVAAGVPLVRVLPGDAAMSGDPVPEVAKKVLNSLQKALWKEEIDRAP